MKLLSIIFSALFSVIAASGTPKTTETFTFVGVYSSASAYTTGTHDVWTAAKATTAGKIQTAHKLEQVNIQKEISKRVVPSSSVFVSVTSLDATTALTQVTITKMALKSGGSAGTSNTLEVHFSATIKAGTRDTTTDAKKLKAALLNTSTHTTLFKTVTSITASTKTSFKVSALYTTTDAWVADYSDLTKSASIVYIKTQMDALANALDAKILVDCADTVKLTNKDIHVNQLIHKAASTTGRKRRSTGTVNVKFTATVKAPKGSTTTTSAKLITAVNKTTNVSGAAKSSAEKNDC